MQMRHTGVEAVANEFFMDRSFSVSLLFEEVIGSERTLSREGCRMFLKRHLLKKSRQTKWAIVGQS